MPTTATRPGSMLSLTDSIPWHSEHTSSRPATAPTTTQTRSSRPHGYPRPLGRGNGFPVVANGHFLRSSTATFRLEPSSRRRGRSFTVRNRRGEKVFHVAPKSLSLRDMKTLVEYHQGVPVPLARMQQHLLSARSTVTIHRVDGSPLLVLQKTTIVNVHKRAVHGYIRHKTTKPDLVITADSKSRNYVLRDHRSNEIARLVRYRRSKRGTRPRRYAYRLYVNPGYDNVLFIMCAICIHEMWEQ